MAKYKGFTNYQTWLVAEYAVTHGGPYYLHLCNTRNVSKKELAHDMETWFRGFNPLDKDNWSRLKPQPKDAVWGDLLKSAIDMVNWNEVVIHVLKAPSTNLRIPKQRNK